MDSLIGQPYFIEETLYVRTYNMNLFQLTYVLHYVGFSSNQNARYMGNRCSLRSTPWPKQPCLFTVSLPWVHIHGGHIFFVATLIILFSFNNSKQIWFDRMFFSWGRMRSSIFCLCLQQIQSQIRKPRSKREMHFSFTAIQGNSRNKVF